MREDKSIHNDIILKDSNPWPTTQPQGSSLSGFTLLIKYMNLSPNPTFSFYSYKFLVSRVPSKISREFQILGFFFLFPRKTLIKYFSKKNFKCFMVMNNLLPLYLFINQLDKLIERDSSYLKTENIFDSVISRPKQSIIDRKFNFLIFGLHESSKWRLLKKKGFFWSVYK